MNVLVSRIGKAACPLSKNLTARCIAFTTKKKDDKNSLDIKSLEDAPVLLETDSGLSEEQIEQKRNKSGLRDGHRNVLHNLPPPNNALYQFQETVKYKQRIFGRYGMEASDVTIGIAWPTKKKVEEMKEYESVCYPEPIHQTWDKIKQKNIENAESIRAREATIAKNMLKMDAWTAELNAKVAKKEAEIRAARERKERLIEEVRRTLGFLVSPKDERFKLMLAEKDKAEAKLKKAAKKEARQQKLMAMITAAADKKSETNTTDSPDIKNSNEPVQ